MMPKAESDASPLSHPKPEQVNDLATSPSWVALISLYLFLEKKSTFTPSNRKKMGGFRMKIFKLLV